MISYTLEIEQWNEETSQFDFIGEITNISLRNAQQLSACLCQDLANKYACTYYKTNPSSRTLTKEEWLSYLSHN